MQIYPLKICPDGAFMYIVSINLIKILRFGMDGVVCAAKLTLIYKKEKAHFTTMIPSTMD